MKRGCALAFVAALVGTASLGDCELAGPPAPVGLTGPQIVLQSDGNAQFSSRGRSTDSNDTFCVALRFHRAGSDVPIATCPIVINRMECQDLPDPGNWGDFNRSFTCDKGLFNLIATAGAEISC
jgi:hypothetical protein